MKDPLYSILEKAATGKRISCRETRRLASCKSVDELHALGRAALRNRISRFARKATYVVSLAVNPSNICDGACGFCHYHAKEKEARAYVLTEADIMKRLQQTQPTEVHITGGMNRFWTFERTCGLVAIIRKQYPHMHIKAHTAVEIARFAEQAGISIEQTLARLKEAGLQSLTGGGAELFSARMRRKYCASKLRPQTWLSVHKTAHRLGIMSNATLLYGLGEMPAEIAEHLLALRKAQDESGGFACFVPLAYQPSQRNPAEHGPGPFANLQIIALARLVLDNFPHIKAYWPMIGTDTAAAALSWGADDLDGTLGEEKIAHAGNTSSPLALDRIMMRDIIRLGGFTPVERDGLFRPVRNIRKHPRPHGAA